MTVCILPHRRDPDRARNAGPGLLVCLGCRGDLHRALVDLPALYDGLIERHVRSGLPSAGQRVSGSATRPIPHNEDVGDVRGRVRFELAAWSASVAEQRAVTAPDSRSPSVTARFLLRHLEWLLSTDGWRTVEGKTVARDETVTVFADTVRELRRDAYGLLYPTGRRRFDVGPCPEIVTPASATTEAVTCPGTLVALLRPDDDLLPSSWSCETCGMELPASRWASYGRRLQRAGRLPADR